MRVFFLILIVLAVLFFASRGISDLGTVSTYPSESTPVSKEVKIESIAFDGKTYNFLFRKIANLEKLFLYPNFEALLSASEFFSKNSCQVLVSGGFYTKENKPVGLFISEGKTYRDQNRNALFNGILSLTYDNKPAIGESIVTGSTRFALQTGPVLLDSGETRALTLKSDEMARRMVAAIDREGSMVFIALFNKESEFLGPNLADLPRIVEEISAKYNLNLIDAVNLDGGTASAYYENTTSLSEASPVGSFFCLK